MVTAPLKLKTGVLILPPIALRVMLSDAVTGAATGSLVLVSRADNAACSAGLSAVSARRRLTMELTRAHSLAIQEISDSD